MTVESQTERIRKRLGDERDEAYEIAYSHDDPKVREVARKWLSILHLATKEQGKVRGQAELRERDLLRAAAQVRDLASRGSAEDINRLAAELEKQADAVREVYLT